MCGTINQLPPEDQLGVYKNFFEHAPIGLVRSDLETGEFLLANEYAARLLGFENADDMMENGHSRDFYPDHDRERLIRELRKNGFVNSYEIELTIPRTGEVIWISATFHLNCGGSCIEGCLKDITELMCLRKKHLENMKQLGRKMDVKLSSLAG